jgi:hypothetical protein
LSARPDAQRFASYLAPRADIRMTLPRTVLRPAFAHPNSHVRTGPLWCDDDPRIDDARCRTASGDRARLTGAFGHGGLHGALSTEMEAHMISIRVNQLKARLADVEARLASETRRRDPFAAVIGALTHEAKALREEMHAEQRARHGRRALPPMARESAR